MILDLAHDGHHAIGDAAPELDIGAPPPVVFGQAQRRDRHVVVERQRRALIDVVLGDLDGLLHVPRQQALIKALGRRQHRAAAEQDAQELEPGHVAADHHEAHGERRRQEQAHRSPQQRPEDRGDTMANDDKPVEEP